MDTYMLWEELVDRMGDPAKWFANVHAQMTPNRRLPQTLADSVNAPVTSVAYDAQARSLTFTIAGRIFTYAYGDVRLCNVEENQATKEPYLIRIMHEADPIERCGSFVDGDQTLCLELTQAERWRADDARIAENLHILQERIAARNKDLAEKHATSVRAMAAKVVPLLEQRLVGKRIVSIGVGDGALLIFCEDGASLHVRTSSHAAIQCGDLEINDLDSDC